MTAMTQKIQHPFEPICDKSSRILILGSFPSVKSREQSFYYGHPRNRFWYVLSGIYGEKTPLSVDERKAFLKEHGIALFDVIQSCEIVGSSDSSIKNALPNDIHSLIEGTSIEKIITNGRLAHKLYEKHIAENVAIPEVCLPSTSPANAAFSLERLIEEWKNEII